MNANWLWDRNLSKAKVKKILRKPSHPRFMEFAALLLSRTNEVREVFDKYIEPVHFCEKWNGIKKQMRKNAWADPRVHYWQAVYEKTLENLRKKGIHVRPRTIKKLPELFLQMGRQIQESRKRQGMTQSQLAKKMKISQQMISHIEKGRQNVSLLTIQAIAAGLGQNVQITLDDEKKKVTSSPVTA